MSSPAVLPPVAEQKLLELGYDVTASRTVRGTDGSLLSVMYNYREEPRVVDSVRFMDTPGVRTAPGTPKPGPSGYRIGFDLHAVIHYGNGSFTCIVPGLQSVTRLHWTGPFSRPGGAARFGDPKTEDFYLRLEAVLRWLIANAEVRRADTYTSRVSGRDYTVHRNAAGKEYVSARVFAQREGMALFENRDDARFMLRTPKGDMIFPLGCNQVKVGSEWVRLGAITGAVNDEPYIPLEVIQRFSL